MDRLQKENECQDTTIKDLEKRLNYNQRDEDKIMNDPGGK